KQPSQKNTKSLDGVFLQVNLSLSFRKHKMSNNIRKENAQSSSRHLTVSGRNSSNAKNIQLISLALKKSAETGVQHHKILMDDLISRKQPLKSSQVKEFYMLNLQKIRSAFDSTYQSLHKIGSPHLKKMIDDAKADMTSKIENKIEVILTKYNNSIEAVSKQIQDMTIATETNYSNNLDNLNLEEMTIEQVKLEGERLKAKSILNFELLVKHLNLNEDCMKMELISKLNEKFQDLIEEAEGRVKDLEKNSLNTLNSSVNPNDDSQKQEFNSSELKKPSKDPVEQILLTQQKIFQEQNESIQLVQERLKHLESVELENKILLKETAVHLKKVEETVKSSVTAINNSLAEIQAKIIGAEKSTAQNFENIQGTLQQILDASQFKIPSGPYKSSIETEGQSSQMSQNSIQPEDHKLNDCENGFGSKDTQSKVNDRRSSSDLAVTIGNGLKTDKGPHRKGLPDNTVSYASISKSSKQKRDEKENLKSRNYPGSAKTVSVQEENPSARRTDDLEMNTELRAEQTEPTPVSVSGMKSRDATETTNKSPRTTNLSERNIALTHSQTLDIAGRATEPPMGQKHSTNSKSTKSWAEISKSFGQTVPNGTDLAVSTSSGVKTNSVVTTVIFSLFRLYQSLYMSNSAVDKILHSFFAANYFLVFNFKLNTRIYLKDILNFLNFCLHSKNPKHTASEYESEVLLKYNDRGGKIFRVIMKGIVATALFQSIVVAFFIVGSPCSPRYITSLLDQCEELPLWVLLLFCPYEYIMWLNAWAMTFFYICLIVFWIMESETWLDTLSGSSFKKYFCELDPKTRTNTFENKHILQKSHELIQTYKGFEYRTPPYRFQWSFPFVILTSVMGGLENALREPEIGWSHGRGIIVGSKSKDELLPAGQ
ncbi:unnamed protein product, partial [Allacma fusca]